MDNTLAGLNDRLFEQLDKLSNAKSSEQLEEEVLRAEAIVKIGGIMINNANVILKATEFKTEVLGRSNIEMPKMLK